MVACLPILLAKCDLSIYWNSPNTAPSGPLGEAPLRRWCISVANDKKTFPKPQKQALKNVKVTKKSSKQMSTFGCEKCHQRPLAEFCLFSKFSGTFDDLHCPPLVWARSDGRWVQQSQEQDAAYHHKYCMAGNSTMKNMNPYLLRWKIHIRNV